MNVRLGPPRASQDRFTSIGTVAHVPIDLAQPDALRRLPRKRIGTGVLLFNGKRAVGLVNPTYEEHWEVPGGMAEVGESRE
jgi:8-oxo-dGTP pyrophosphatase MutT (NUDIX family)